MRSGNISYRLFFPCLIALLCSSCEKIFVEPDPANSPVQNYEYLWTDIHDRYSFLEYKNLNWDSLHKVFSERIQDGMSEEELFSVLADMMNTLRDGHANLVSPFNTSVYFPIFTGSPANFDSRLVLDHYLLRDPENYFITGALNNTILDTLGVKVGYIRYASFSSPVKPLEIDYVINRFVEANVDGVIFDVRSNGGGSLSNVFTLADRFADQARHCYTSEIKTGPGPEDFGDEEKIYVGPEGGQQFTGRTAVLINRGSYSATSFLALAMKPMPYVRLIGDSTGGGLGAPSNGELPNGWNYRFSVTRTLAPGGENWEDGIPPDILMDLDPDAADQGFDSMIERAIEYVVTGQ